MPKTKTTPKVEAYLARAREARAEAAERLRERPPRRSEDMGVLRAKFEKRRSVIRGDAERGYLRKHAVAVVAEAFNDEQIAELLLVDAEGKEAMAARAERRREQKELAAMARRIEREQIEAGRREREAEAARRLGVG